MDVEAQVAKIAELQGSRLRRYREAAGLSQVEVAARLGVSQQAVAKWERANDVPDEHWPALSVLIGRPESYPGAPFNAVRRRAWLEERGRALSLLGARDAPARKSPKAAA